jgi:arabinose-5-phosphate isomerase
VVKKDKKPVIDKNIAAGRRVVRLEARSVRALENRIDRSFSRAVNLIYKIKGRVIVTGLGKSGVIGRKISATLTSTGTTSYFLHAAEGSHGDLGMVHRDDLVICISKSGETQELQNLVVAFKKLNIPIIAITGQLKSSLAENADVVLNVAVKEEACPHDLAPTTSTTATLVMGDALAIALLEKRNFSREEFAFIHPGGSLGKKLLTTVDDLMEKNENLPHCTYQDDMRRVTIEMAHKRGICPIVDEQFRVIGVITTGDLNRLLEQREQFFDLVAEAVMTKNPKMVASGTLASEALEKMEHYRVVALPVINGERKLVGVVHLHDILQMGIRN